MLPDLSITSGAPLPLPRCPDNLQALTGAHLAQLKAALRRGETSLVLPVYQWPQSPWSPAAGAYAVLKGAVDFLYDCHRPFHLEFRCVGLECLRTYQLQWNMWFAGTKDERSMETVTDL